EIISEFKVGDWLHNETSGITFKCIEVEENVVRADIPYQFAFNTEHGFVRHATPEEIAKEKEYRWWEEFDRLPWELKKGDVIYSKVTKSYYEVLNVFVDDSVNLEGTTPNEFNQ